MKFISNRKKWVIVAALLLMLTYFAALSRLIQPAIRARFEGAALVVLVLSLLVSVICVIFTLTALIFKHDRSDALKNLGGRMIELVIIIAFFAVIVAMSEWMAYTPDIVGEDGKPLAGSIASLEKVHLGGEDQWLIIRGQDVNKPVLLFLSGGPGASEAARVLRFNRELEKHFVVVIWEQRGCGKSFPSLNPKSDLTVEQYTSDIIELSEMMRERFDEQKIYLMGHSWGTIIGVRAAQARPDLFHAYIGSAQMVDVLETDRLIYHTVLEHSRRTEDSRSVQKLEAQGQPPYAGKSPVQQYAALFELEYGIYEYPNIQNEAYRRDGDILMLMLKQPEYGWLDRLYYLLGLVKTFNVVYPQLQDMDFRLDATRLDLPVYLILGRHDMNNPYQIPEEYFNMLQTPLKQLYFFENSGHGMIWEEADQFHALMVKIVLPETYNVTEEPNNDDN